MEFSSAEKAVSEMKQAQDYWIACWCMKNEPKFFSLVSKILRENTRMSK
jgi:hypothetical protein